MQVYDIQMIMGGKAYAISPDEYVFASVQVCGNSGIESLPPPLFSVLPAYSLQPHLLPAADIHGCGDAVPPGVDCRCHAAIM